MYDITPPTATINTSINNSAKLSDLKFNWDGTNNTLYNDSLVLMYNFDNVTSIKEQVSFDLN